jgi:hypothetical protein
MRFCRVAVIASTTTVTDPQSARQLGRASVGVSVAGIIVTVIVIIVVVAIVVGTEM